MADTPAVGKVLLVEDILERLPVHHPEALGIDQGVGQHIGHAITDGVDVAPVGGGTEGAHGDDVALITGDIATDGDFFLLSFLAAELGGGGRREEAEEEEGCQGAEVSDAITHEC